jgi:hypothetical protein
MRSSCSFLMSLSESIAMKIPRCPQLDHVLNLTALHSLGDASEELMRSALVQRAAHSSDLSVHRLVQSAARKRLDKTKSAKAFDAAVHMLCWGFPDHSNVDIGHQVSTWPRCEKCLPHVGHLVELAKSSGAAPGDRQKYADLLLRCSW